ncbi:MAG: hypothetical protein POG74_01535 [Acidocella sp.]|nr:hypothetical protein [Acidocella sp.]
MGDIADCANAGAATPKANIAAKAADFNDVMVKTLLNNPHLILGAGRNDYSVPQPY